MKHYALTRLPDLVFVTLVSVALSFAVFSGFVLTDSYSASIPAVALVCLLLAVVCLAFSYRRLTVGIGIGLLICAAAAFILAMYQSDALRNEEQNSLLIALLVTFAVTMVSYLLSRSRVGTVVLLLLGVLVQAGAAFLGFPEPLWAFVLFLFACPALLLHRVYTASIRKADAGTVGMKGYLFQSLALVLCALLLSSGIYYGAIRPMNPPTMELKLIQLLRSMEPLQVLGVSRTHVVLTTDLQSQTAEDREQSREEGEEEDEALENTEAELTRTDLPSLSAQTQQVATVYYPIYRQTWFYWAVAGGVFLIVCIFVGRWHIIRRRHRQIAALPHGEAILRYYPFFLNRLSKCGIRRQEGRTLSEFVRDSGPVLEPFDEGESSFQNLTLTYEKLLYGGLAPTEEEYGRYENFYSRFYRNLRKEKGTIRYLVQIFRF